MRNLTGTLLTVSLLVALAGLARADVIGIEQRNKDKKCER
jgi:hypothetical protein